MATGSQKNIALIGCGARGRSYLENLKNGFKGGWQLSAIMKNRVVNAEEFRRKIFS